MTNKLFIAVLIASLMLVAGCQQKQDVSLAGKSFVGGDLGLSVSFLPGQPPADVFDSENPFQVSVKIENKGEYAIENAQDVDVTITGISPSDFRVSSGDLFRNIPETLRGASIDIGTGKVVAGDSTIVDFPEMNYFKEVSGSIPFTIRANLCYEYGTSAQGKLCVRQDLRSTSATTGLCNPTRDIIVENSGAPVKVSAFRQTVSGSDKIDFYFTIKKTGTASDSLYKMGTACNPATIPDRDTVFVEVLNTGLGELTCSGLREGTATSGFVKLFNDQQEIRCSQKITTPSDFEKVVEIKLRYAYSQFIDTKVTVKQAS